ncbi:MAG: type IV pilus assembly protein FimV, partial [Steroidobacteraceae bacterium]
MVAKSVKWVLAGILAGPSAAMALGLGDIHLNSTLNAPFDANIDLVGATPDELATLTPKIASRDTFAQHGLDWPAFLANVTVKAVHTAGGGDVLQLRSSEPVTEPFLTLLVELDWDRGHFVREYTVLLDPPLYAPNSGRVAREAVQAPTSGAAANEGTIQRGQAAAGAASSSGGGSGGSGSEAVPAAAGGAAAAGEAATYTVRSGDSLSRIALRLDRPDEYQWMVATYRANPEAFDRNMNILRAGAVLRIPSASAVDAIGTAQAGVEVHRQFAAWRGSRAATARTGEPRGRLQLVTPGAEAGSAGAGAGTGTGTGSGAAAGQSARALQGEVQSLQAQLSESRRLLDLKNAELAQLQAKLGARGSASAGSAAALTPPAAPAAAASTSAASTSVASAAAPTAAEPATPPAPVAAATAAGVANAPAGGTVATHP